MQSEQQVIYRFMEGAREAQDDMEEIDEKDCDEWKLMTTLKRSCMRSASKPAT